MLTNSQMIAGRFAKLAFARKRLARINACLAAGGSVIVGTATRNSKYGPAWAGRFFVGAKGSLFVDVSRAGGKRSTLCLDFNSLSFTK